MAQIKLFDSLRMALSQELQGLIHLEFPEINLTLAELSAQLVEPPNPELGDLAFGAYILAKQVKRSPVEVALKLAQRHNQMPAAESLISVAEAVGPYLNIKLTLQAYGKHVLQSIESKDFFKQKLIKDPPKTMIEYSQPNTHKELHVGHMRNMCLGDALIRLHKYADFEIISSTFPGDVGTHVAKCLWYMKHKNTENPPQERKGEWLGRMYSLANNLLEDQKGTPQEEKNKEELTAILRQLEEKKGPYFDLWKETRQWSIELMQKVYDWADIHFDKWYWESDVDSESVQYVKSLLAQNKVVESQGAIGINLEEDNLGFCLLLKSDGTGLYATKDLELARRKFQDYKIEKSIYVVDMRQALHFKQVFKALEKLGFSQSKNCYHLQYNFVELPDGPMSSRKGNIIPILTLIEKMQSLVKEEYLSRYQDSWTPQEMDLVASQVAKGAIKYGMLRIDNNKKIVFDMKEWLKIDGESGPFIQYSVARIESLGQKFNYTKEPIKPELLIHSAERVLMAHLLNFNWVIARCLDNMAPSPLCTYLYQLAKKFNHFYHECSIGQAENNDLLKARLHLAMAAGAVLRNGLQLLGIPAPQRM